MRVYTRQKKKKEKKKKKGIEFQEGRFNDVFCFLISDGTSL